MYRNISIRHFGDSERGFIRAWQSRESILARTLCCNRIRKIDSIARVQVNPSLWWTDLYVTRWPLTVSTILISSPKFLIIPININMTITHINALRSKYISWYYFHRQHYSDFDLFDAFWSHISACGLLYNSPNVQTGCPDDSLGAASSPNLNTRYRRTIWVGGKIADYQTGWTAMEVWQIVRRHFVQSHMHTPVHRGFYARC